MSDPAKARGKRDFFVNILKIGLPAAIGVILAFLALAPLREDKEVSFILDKNKVETAQERMRVENAQYRGVDAEGRPFVLNARSAVQARSADPVVDIATMNAQMQMREGPARLTADQARYNMEQQRVAVRGPINFTAADGYRLDTSDVAVNLREQTLASGGRVQGQMPLGRFEADRMAASLDERKVVLEGRARLRIEQGAIR